MWYRTTCSVYNIYNSTIDRFIAELVVTCRQSRWNEATVSRLCVVMAGLWLIRQCLTGVQPHPAPDSNLGAGEAA